MAALIISVHGKEKSCDRLWEGLMNNVSCVLLTWLHQSGQTLQCLRASDEVTCTEESLRPV